MSAITVVAQLIARPEHREALQTELLNLVVATRQEAGCLEYRLHQDLDDPNRYLFFETWQDRPSLERHLASAHFMRYAAATAHCITDKTVRILQSIA